MKFSFFVLIFAFVTSHAQATSIDWSGMYRVEGISIKGPDIKGGNSSAYALHYLGLTPKLVAADNINIYARFDVLNSTDYNYGNQLGDFIGRGPYNSSNLAVNSGNSNTLSNSAGTTNLRVSQAYMNWVQEYGALLVGRMPKSFGLGMTYSAGENPFDHWFDSHDVIAYRIAMGNISITPMYGKMSEGATNHEDDVFEYSANVTYENPETDLKMGAYYEEKHSPGVENPAGGTTPPFGGDTTKTWDRYNHKNWNLFLSKKRNKLHFGLEAGFNTGDTGVRNTTGETISLDSYALATELTYDWTERTTLSLKAGFASGDDPKTKDKFEGYIFNRNYDVGLLLFNYVMGQYDILNTGSTDHGTAGGVDSESLSNVMYFAPTYAFHKSEKWLWKGTFVYARLMQDPLGTDVSKSLGYEADLSVVYTPTDRLMMSMDYGILLPGEAFKGGSANNYTTDTAMGFMFRTAIKF